jgi:hypothetical protein
MGCKENKGKPVADCRCELNGLYRIQTQTWHFCVFLAIFFFLGILVPVLHLHFTYCFLFVFASIPLTFDYS